MFLRNQVNEGMTVRSIDGEKLGKVFAVQEDAFFIEKGFFFPKDYRVLYADISDLRDGELILRHGRERLLNPPGDDANAPLVEGLPLAATAAAGDLPRARRTEEVAIPVHHEELDVTKRDVHSGEVRIHKDVVEEVRTVEVPLRHEEVRVEHRATGRGQPAMNAAFQEETIVVPLHAEEVEVRKRTVLDDEVVIHKDVIEEERRVAESVRREEVDIRTPDDDDTGRSLSLGPDDPAPSRS